MGTKYNLLRRLNLTIQILLYMSKLQWMFSEAKQTHQTYWLGSKCTLFCKIFAIYWPGNTDRYCQNAGCRICRNHTILAPIYCGCCNLIYGPYNYSYTTEIIYLWKWQKICLLLLHEKFKISLHNWLLICPVVFCLMLSSAQDWLLLHVLSWMVQILIRKASPCWQIMIYQLFNPLWVVFT